MLIKHLPNLSLMNAQTFLSGWFLLHDGSLRQDSHLHKSNIMKCKCQARSQLHESQIKY